jgi:hypothetical protein
MHYTLPIFIYISFTNFRQAFYFIIPFRLLLILLSTSTHPKVGLMMENKRGRPKQNGKKAIWQDGKRKTGS